VAAGRKSLGHETRCRRTKKGRRREERCQIHVTTAKGKKGDAVEFMGSAEDGIAIVFMSVFHLDDEEEC